MSHPIVILMYTVFTIFKGDTFSFTSSLLQTGVKMGSVSGIEATAKLTTSPPAKRATNILGGCGVCIVPSTGTRDCEEAALVHTRYSTTDGLANEGSANVILSENKQNTLKYLIIIS